MSPRAPPEPHNGRHVRTPRRRVSRHPRIRDLVNWREPRPATTPAQVGKVVLHWVGIAIELVSGVLSPGLGTPVEIPSVASRQRLPRDPAEEIPGFRCTVVGGAAPWMPSVHADRATLHMSATAAWIVPPGIPRRIELDLPTLRPTQLVPQRGLAGLAGTWTATLVGEQTAIELRGPWIAIAWLAHLGHWPEPTAA